MNRSIKLLSISTLLFFNLFSIYYSISISQFRRARATILPKAIIDHFSSRSHRQHHLLFHSLRNQWNLISSELRQRLRNLGWEPPRPSISANRSVIRDNDSGEDFLYMHRIMIEEVNKILSKGNYSYGKRIIGWRRIPLPGDIEYPVPAAYTGRSQGETDAIARFKSDDFYYNTLVNLENNLYNPDFLRNMTLGQLGAYIEFDVHNQLHARWSSSLPAYRPEPDPFYDVDQISTEWDVPSYDWLNDFYSSQVNTVFWKLHGWVDDRIKDWQKANGFQVIQWKGTWTGPPGHEHSPHSNHSTNPNQSADMKHKHPPHNTSHTSKINKGKDHSHKSSNSLKSWQSSNSRNKDLTSNTNGILQPSWTNFESQQSPISVSEWKSWQPTETQGNFQPQWEPSKIWGNFQSSWQPIQTGQFYRSILAGVGNDEHKLDKEGLINELGKSDIITTLLQTMK